MPKDTKNKNSVMRAPTTRERIMDAIGSVGEAVGNNPAVRILGMLNKDFGGEAPEPLELPNGQRAEFKIGMMPGGPGKGMIRGLSNMERGYSSPMANRNRATSFLAGDNARVSTGRRAFENRNTRPTAYAKDMGNPLPAEARVSHPALPPEFQEIIAKPRMPEPRTAPIDMNNLPSGKMEYLDPDVAEYMNPSRMLDFSNPATQRKLRFLTGK